MAHRDFHAVPGSKMFCQLFRKINRAMLATGAAERNHQVFKSSLVVAVYAGIDQRHHTGEKLMHAFLLIEIFNHRSFLAGKRLKALFTARIRQAPSIENKSAAMTRFVLRRSLMKRETKNAQRKRLGLNGE